MYCASVSVSNEETRGQMLYIDTKSQSNTSNAFPLVTENTISAIQRSTDQGNNVSTVSAIDRLCGLVVRVLGYRSGDPGSIPGTTRRKKKYWVWNGVHSAS
jgi:hypothetical protein